MILIRHLQFIGVAVQRVIMVHASQNISFSSTIIIRILAISLMKGKVFFMKKTLSLACALLMAVSCAGISANAETKFATLNDGYTFVVTNVEGNNYLMEYYSALYYQNGVNDNGEAGILTYYSTSEEFAVGDILIPTKEFSICDTSIQYIHFGVDDNGDFLVDKDANGFQKIGTCEELGLKVPVFDEVWVKEWEDFYVVKETEPQIYVNPPEIVLFSGDASGDGEINILDVVSLNKAIMGKETLTEEQLKAIDFNGNGKPDADEALTILKYIVGLVTDFTA